MRTRAILAAGLMLAASMAGCGKPAPNDSSVATARSGPASANPSASAAGTIDPDAPLKFSRCMREQGMTWFPDPSDGKLSIRVPDSVKKEDFDKAQQACRKWAPDGENAPPPSAEDIEKTRQMAKCMRENGVPNFPDPGPKGEIGIDSKSGIDPDSPTFQAAEKKCDSNRPKGPRDVTSEGGTKGGGA
ncbi:hypothetical protein Acy02nite_24190 [Actinoplanes cyaneus]|uniref:Lipoprotein n=1 Tax=Actinoplanes cyaneus TaxID=52696 RepID=A0A919M4T5_9ACTN|nr:hypothetical protein [Actinoplanes cyaneus]MCW2136316.1 hypothetical protein [Actinoplanes cyaneus]GID64538.1 hypothetical protein Acy02nite_24190 [Actinoplanes cyaneus]